MCEQIRVEILSFMNQFFIPPPPHTHCYFIIVLGMFLKVIQEKIMS